VAENFLDNRTSMANRVATKGGSAEGTPTAASSLLVARRLWER
jgi:hypothetical protein